MYSSEHSPGDCGTLEANYTQNSSSKDQTSADHKKIKEEYHLANETVNVSPRSAFSAGSSNDLYASPKAKTPIYRQRPKSARSSTSKVIPPRQPPTLSSIPLPVKNSGPIRIPPMLKNTRSVSRTSSMLPRTASLASKHTLEIQFLNKNKRYVQMKKELLEKQKPLVDLYQNLNQIKKRLEELGKTVKLEEVRIVSFEDFSTKQPPSGASGEQMSLEIVSGMKHSIEEIPKTLMEICKNLLSRRALIVELLESVTKSEIDVNQVSDKIESLKNEGQQLQQSLEAVTQQHESKISDLVGNWQKLLTEKQSNNLDIKVEELERRLREEERLREDSSTIIHELQRKLEDRKCGYEKSVGELNATLQTLREQIKKLEQELETERKTSVDFKTRNNSNAQSLKSMRTKITELENERKDFERSNAELQRKITQLQGQLKLKESQWAKEKEDLNKNLKHQEHLLQKLTADKNQFETRLDKVENDKNATKTDLETTISTLNDRLQSTEAQLSQVTAERDDALEKCVSFENYVARMGADFKESMQKVSQSIEWGAHNKTVPEADIYMEDMAKELRIRELEDQVRVMAEDKQNYLKKVEVSKKEPEPSLLEKELLAQRVRVQQYESLLEETEVKLKQKCGELEKLQIEMRQLKVFSEALEEQNANCPAKDLERLYNEGRQKLNNLTKMLMQKENEIEQYKTTIQKHKDHMTEMDNLVRYRENMVSLLKASRNEIQMEKDSLARYSKEVRGALAEVSSECRVKEKQIATLQEKLEVREKQLRSVEKELKSQETLLKLANEKRHKLQETVGILEKELQKTRAARKMPKSRSGGSLLPWRLLDSVYEVMEDKKPNKDVSHYYNSLMMARRKESDLDQVQSLESEYRTTSNTPPDNASSNHTDCHHKANSRSLISLSLQTVDFMKTKLNFLKSVNVDSSHGFSDNELTDDQNQFDTTLVGTDKPTSNSRNLSEVLELAAHRYEFLQNQAQESYEDLSNLVKLAVLQRNNRNK